MRIWRKRWLPAALAVPLLILLVVALHPRWLVERLAEQSPEVLYFVDTERPMVALTIDDGPDSAATPLILDVLRRHRAHATFFVITERVLGNERLLAQPRWFRPGGGWFNERMLRTARRHGYRCALGSVYPFDAAIPSAGVAAWYVARSVGSGSVIVLHDGGARSRRTAAALERILPDLERRGLEAVTLSALTAAPFLAASARTAVTTSSLGCAHAASRQRYAALRLVVPQEVPEPRPRDEGLEQRLVVLLW